MPKRKHSAAEASLVAADKLLELGDAHGELILLERAYEAAREAGDEPKWREVIAAMDQLLADNPQVMLGELARSVRERGLMVPKEVADGWHFLTVHYFPKLDVQLEWWRGFPRQLRLDPQRRCQGATIDFAHRALMTLPYRELTTRLKLVGNRGTGTAGAHGVLVEFLAALPRLVSIHVEDHWPTDPIGPLTPPATVRVLTLQTDTDEALRWLGQPLPELEMLSVWLTPRDLNEQRDWPALLTPERFPKLRTLRLLHAPTDPECLDALVIGGLLPQLLELNIAGGPISAHTNTWLQENAGRFSELGKLHIDGRVDWGIFRPPPNTCFHQATTTAPCQTGIPSPDQTLFDDLLFFDQDE